MAALSFDDFINGDSDNDIRVPFEFESVPDTIFELGNPSCDLLQTDPVTVAAKTSPFHQSDSGLSEDFDSVLGSPEAGSESLTIGSRKMLDELVDSMDVQPFCRGADRDLEDYFGGLSPDSDTDVTGMNNEFESQALASDNSNPGSPEYLPRSINFRKVKTHKQTSVVPKVIGPQGISLHSDPLSVSNNLASSRASSVKCIKVLKVIKTSGSSDTTSEVLKALDDRNKKNAVQAKINRERKKQYVKCLEDEIEGLKNDNEQLTSENVQMKIKTETLDEEVGYLRAVLANDSSLSKLLSNIGNVNNVRLSSSIGSRKRSADHDHSYVPSKRGKFAATAGICLHVDNDTVSLEFCSECSKMAKGEDK